MPTRMCLVCRERAEKGSLLRVVREGTQLRLDRAQRHCGRGAYLHPRWQCWSRIDGAKGWERALRLPRGSLSSEDLLALRDVLRQAVCEVAGSPVSHPQPSGQWRIRL